MQFITLLRNIQQVIEIQLEVSFQNWTHQAMETNSTEVMTGNIPIDIALRISDHLEIPDMQNWAVAVGMEEQLRGKILYAKRMLTRLESLEFLNASMIETLAETDFRLTFRTMQRLIQQTRSRSNVFLDENDDTTTTEVCFKLSGLGEDEILIEVLPINEDEPQEFHRRHISDLTQPLTQEMARHFDE